MRTLLMGYPPVQGLLYIPSTTIDDIYALYCFDMNLRAIMLEAILVIEKKIKSLLSYAFVEAYGENQSAYLDPRSYISTREVKLQKSIKRLISILQYTIMPPFEHSYIKHQWENHNNVPLWVAVKALTLGNISQMYSLLPNNVQAPVMLEFGTVK